MKHRSLFWLAVYTGVVLLVFTGCRKDFDFDKLKSLDWRPDLAIPLVKDSITFEKALIETDQEKNFYIDENGEVSILLYFKNKAFRITPNDLVKLPPLPFSYERTITPLEEQIIKAQDFGLPPVNFNINLAASAPGLEIQTLKVKKGRIIANSWFSFNNQGYLNITIPNATKNGKTFTKSFGPFIYGTSVDTIELDSVQFDLSASPNLVTIQVGGLIKKGNQPVAGDVIRTEYTVLIDEIAEFKGYLGQQDFSPAEEAVKITAFNNAYVLGDLYFIDPRVSITLQNSIGIPAAVTISKLWALNEASNVTLDISDRLGANKYFEVPSPAFNATQPVSFTMTYTNENTGNSMHEMFNLKPDKVFFKINTQINPHGKTVNFFNDTSSLYANLKVQLPLFGHFDHLTLQDTFDYALNMHKDIESMEFRTKVTNGLPLTARMQVYFTDSAYNILDSLTGTNQIIIREAPVDPATFLPYPGQFGERDTSFFVDLSRMDKLVTARKILVRAVMNSANEGIPNVKIKAAQLLRVNFSALVKLRKSIKP